MSMEKTIDIPLGRKGRGRKTSSFYDSLFEELQKLKKGKARVLTIPKDTTCNSFRATLWRTMRDRGITISASAVSETEIAVWVRARQMEAR